MKHWTENDFHKWLYGLKEEDSHVETCSECRVELERLRLERRQVLAVPEVSAEFLAEQRRQIHSRINQPSRGSTPLRWALSVAMVLAVVVGLTLPRFRKSVVTLTNDEQLYSDLAAMERTSEPKAIQPLHQLFEK
jgi:hypothetical protein